MPAIRRLLCVSFVLWFAVSLHAAVTGVAINIDGKPVSGAKVSLFAPELIAATGPRLMSADPQRKPLATMTTDSGGKFTFDVPKDQPVVDVRIDAPGYAPAGVRLLADDDAGAMLLTQAPTVRGTITAGGKPVAERHGLPLRRRDPGVHDEDRCRGTLLGARSIEVGVSSDRHPSRLRDHRGAPWTGRGEERA